MYLAAQKGFINATDEDNIQIFKMRDIAYNMWLNFNSDKNIVTQDISLITYLK